jgi:hypothetical protein
MRGSDLFLPWVSIHLPTLKERRENFPQAAPPLNPKCRFRMEDVKSASSHKFMRGENQSAIGY